MCGITGIVGFSLSLNTKETEAYIKRMSAIQSHRGPDGDNTIKNTEGTAYFGMNSLLIVNDSANIGPYWDENQRFMLTFNGEIYNYKELALEWNIDLDIDKTDAQILFIGFNKYGINFVNSLDGMFAIAIFDTLKKELFLIRDRFGEKPLYYKFQNHILSFASEVKSILQYSKSALKITDEFRVFETPIGSDTLFEDVNILLPGHYLKFTLDRNILNIECFYDISSFGKKFIEYDERLFKTLLDKAINNCIPKKPFGLLLSGGLDSTILAYQMKPDYVFTIYYENEICIEETKKAKDIAYNIDAKHIIIKPNAKDFQNYFPKVIFHLDYPMDISSFSQYMLYKEAIKYDIKVLISGIGPDETMIGYARHVIFLNPDKSSLSEKYDPLIEMYLNRIVKTTSLYEKYFELIKRNQIFGNHKNTINELFNKGIDIGQSITYVETYINLPMLLKSVDKMSSAFGLEVRSPYLYHKLYEYVVSLKLETKFEFPNITKKLLRNYAREIGVPDIIINDYNKVGFFTPINDWIANELYDYFAKETREISTDTSLQYLNSESTRGKFCRNNFQKLSIAIWKKIFN